MPVSLRTRMIRVLLTALVVSACTPSAVPLATRVPVATSTRQPRPPTATPVPTQAVERGSLDEATGLAGQVSRERLLADIAWLADDAREGRKAGTAGEDAAGAWLAARMADLELEPFSAAGLEDYYQPFDLGDAQGENVLAVLPGSTHPDRYVLVGAHYDHLGVMGGEIYNGADDDASGVAAVLEAARVLRAAGRAPEETIVFVAFSAEEQGGLGSYALGSLLDEKGLAERSLLLNLEMLGAAQGQGTYLDVWDEASAGTDPLVQAATLGGAALEVTVKQQGRDPGSDALVFLRMGIPAVSLDVAWGGGPPHPDYHQPTDDVEHIDGQGLTHATQVALATVWLLANDGR